MKDEHVWDLLYMFFSRSPYRYEATHKCNNDQVVIDHLIMSLDCIGYDVYTLSLVHCVPNVMK